MIKGIIEYQETDAKLKAIEQEIGGSEERKKAMAAKKFLDSVGDSIMTLDRRSAELAANNERLQKQREAADDQIKEFKSALDDCGGESEVAYLRKKAEELMAKLTAIENEITAYENEINQILQQYATIRNKTKAAKEQYSDNGAKYAELKKSKEAEMQQIRARLDELEKDVDPEVMEKYKTKRKDKMFPIMYEINGSMCGHCLMELPMAERNRLKNGEIIECSNCRCLLYKGEK